MNIKPLAKKSLKDIKENPIILLPDILHFFVIMITNFLFYKIAKIDVFLNKFDEIQQQYFADPSNISEFGVFFSSEWMMFLVSVVIFVVVTFFIGVGFQTIKFLLIKSVIRRGFAGSLVYAFRKGKRKYYFKLAFLNVFVYLINVIMILFIVGFTVVLNFVTLTSFVRIMTVGFFGLLVAILIRLGLLYRHAVFFLSKKRSATRAVINSFKFALDNGKHVVLIGLFLTAVAVAMVIINGIFMGVSNYFAFENMLLVISFSFFIYLIGKIYNLWVALVLFNDFESKNKK